MHLLLGRLLQFFLPSQCPCCEQFLEEKQQGLCPSCLSTVRWIEPPLCTVCGSPFAAPEAGEHPCGTCLTKRRYFTTARALGSYQGVLQEAIHRWKYEERMSITRLFGQWMTDGLQRYWGVSSFDLLIPVPLHAGRLRERGFNQSLLLATEISHKTGIPCEKRLLQKIKPTVPQIHLSGGEREKEIKEAFRVVHDDRIQKKVILLIDDVFTTGATVNECSKILLASGAHRVDVLTLAHAVKRI